MKITKKRLLMPITACAVAFVAQAFENPLTEGFESYTAGSGITSGANNFLFVPNTSDNAPDASVVTAYETEGTSGKNYLKLSTEDGKLYRSLNDLTSDGKALGTAEAIANDGIDVTARMLFTVTDSSDRPDATDGAKFVMWLEKNAETDAYELKVLGGLFTYTTSNDRFERATGDDAAAIYTLTAKNAEEEDVSINKDSWYTVTIKAFNSKTLLGTCAAPAFQVYVDGVLAKITRTGNILDSDGVSAYGEVSEEVAYIPSLSDAATLQAVGFAGEGAVDDLNISETATFSVANIPDDVTIVSVTANGNEVEADEGKYTVFAGAKIEVTLQAPTGKCFAESSNQKTVKFDATTGAFDSTITAADIVDPVAQIGETPYASLAAALKAATGGATITLLGDTAESGFAIAAGQFPNGVTLDLNAKVFTITNGPNGVYKDAITINTNNYVTISNGTIAAANNTAFRDIIRFYGHADYTSLTLTDVTFDNANVGLNPDKDPEDPSKGKVHDDVECFISADGGNLTINGGSMTAPSDKAANAFYVVKFGNHANATQYKPGTLTINGTVTGDLLLTGGTYVEGDNAVVTGNYYYGKNAYSSWEDANNTVFAARTGVLPETGAEDNCAGQLYKTFAAAIDAAQDNDTITVCSNISEVDVEITKKISIDATGYTVKGASKTGIYAFRIMDGDLTIIGGTFEGGTTNTASPFVIGDWEGSNGTVKEVQKSGKLTISGGTFGAAKASNLIKCAKGELVVNGGTFNVTNSRGVKADGANAKVTVNGGTFNAAGKKAVAVDVGGELTVNGGTINGTLTIESKGGTITIPAASTATFDADQSAFCDDTHMTVLNDADPARYAVVTAGAAIDTTKYQTLADAVAAADANATITLLGAASANGITTTKAVTLQLAGKMLTLDETATLTLGAATTIVNSDTTTGGLTINGQVVVNGSLDFSTLDWGTGGLLPDCAGSLKIGASATVTFWANNDPNAMETNKSGFLSASESGAKFVSGENTWTFDGSKWYLAVATIALNPTTATIKVGETTTLTATVTPAGAKQTVTWTSSEEAVATVKDGVVTAVAAGTATITATAADGKTTATCAITVEAASSDPVIDPTKGETKKEDVVAESTEAAEKAVIESIKAPTAEGMTLDDATYQSYFKATAAAGSETGKYNVTLELDENKVAPDATMTQAAASLDEVIAGTATEATVTNAKVGLWYSFKFAGDLSTLSTSAADEGDRVQAKTATVEIPMPKGSTTSRFWVLNVNTTDKAK